jgi:hypothetical protein
MATLEGDDDFKSSIGPESLLICVKIGSTWIDHTMPPTTNCTLHHKAIRQKALTFRSRNLTQRNIFSAFFCTRSGFFATTHKKSHIMSRPSKRNK